MEKVGMVLREKEKEAKESRAEGKEEEERKGNETSYRGNFVEITVIVNHAAYRCTRVGTISGYREPFLDLPMVFAKVGTMVLSNY